MSLSGGLSKSKKSGIRLESEKFSRSSSFAWMLIAVNIKLTWAIKILNSECLSIILGENQTRTNEREQKIDRDQSIYQVWKLKGLPCEARGSAKMESKSQIFP